MGAAVVAACAIATVVTCGGFAAAVTAVCLVSSGVAATTTAATVAAGAFIGSAMVYGTAVLAVASESNSIAEFNDNGNWGIVILAVGGAAGGGLSGLSASNALSGNDTSKESAISNDVVNLPRVGSALKTDSYHAFPDVVDNYAGYASQTNLGNAILYQIQGELNGKAGRFEWIIQNQQVTHRMFVPGGGLNGVPSKP